MALKCGIVGLPNVGKSTLFNCLSNTKAQSANFPFCTIEPNVGVITVPDDRLTRLVEMCNPRSVVPATVEIVDIAGLVKGASRGEGLGNKFLANIRETDAILHVLRCFDDDNVTHVDGSVDPVRDKEIIDYELQLKDLETIESRISKTQKAAQTGGDKTAKMQYEVLRRYKEALDAGRPARSVKLDTPDEIRYSRELFLLTNKPVLYVCNVDDASAATGNAYVEAVRQAIADEDASLMVVAAQTESEIAELDTYEHQGPAGRRHHTHRFRKRIHTRRGHQVRRLRHPRRRRTRARCRKDGRRRQGLRRTRRRHHALPLQRLSADAHTP